MNDAFHRTAASSYHPPDRSAHISAHSATYMFSSDVRDRVGEQARARLASLLDYHYARACRRAARRGRTIPPRQDFFGDHWGYAYHTHAPWVYPAYLTPGLYYSWDPGMQERTAGGPGGCATATCGANWVRDGPGSGNFFCGGGCSGGGSGGEGGGEGNCGGGGGNCGGGGGGGGKCLLCFHLSLKLAMC